MAVTKKQNKKKTVCSKPTTTASMAASSSQTSRSNFSYSKRLLLPSLFISFAVLLCVILLFSSSDSNSIATLSVDQSPNSFNTVQIVNEFPHDPDAFTQGLLYAGNDVLYESTGLYGKSSVRRVALQTGKVELIKKMDSSIFGEGLTLFGERLFQVTWLTKNGIIYDRKNLRKVGEFSHQMQDGWGLTTDGTVLYGSDGTSTLYQLDPQTFKVIRNHIIKYNDYEVRLLNELEYINGEVWANVWQTDCIARISPKDGMVLGWVFLHDLRQKLGIDSSNGIAWDSSKSRLFVTGKLWPKLYEINLRPVKMQVKDGDVERLCIR